jgi:Sensors of blue-light using FAD
VTQLIRCIYASLAAPSFKEDELPLLLERARHANAAQSLTGMLLYIEGNFFQVLEGEAEAVDAVYTRIIGDPRHTRVTLIIREPIAQRDFSEWTMGFSGVDRLEAGKLIGENDFFTKASCIDDLDGGRAKKLLAAFRNGRWRLERTGVQRVVGPIT